MMNKANLLPHLVIAFCLANHAQAQVLSTPDPVEMAAQEYRQREEALSKFQNDAGGKSANDKEASVEKRREELRLLVKKSFDARQQLRVAQVKSLQRRLQDIELAIGKSQANEEAIIGARVDALLAGGPASANDIVYEKNDSIDGQVKTVRRRISQAGETVTELPGSAGSSAARYQTNVPLPVPTFAPIPIVTTSQLAKQSPADVAANHFDLETRDRLAEIDVEAATAKRDAAKADYEAHKQANEKARGSTPEAEMQKFASTLRMAEIEVQRAKTMLEGIARQRSRADAATSAANDTAPSSPRQAQAERGAGNADINTREQLAQIDLEEAIAKRDAAVKELDSYEKASGAIPARQYQKAQAAVPLMEIEVKRAQTKLEGIARERSDLIASAEAEVEEAAAARQQAEAKRQTTIAKVEETTAEIAKAEAEAANAQTNVDFRQKRYDRATQLKKARTVTQEQFDEDANGLDNAKGALESLRAGLAIARSKALQAKSAAAESQADLELAEVRLRAAKARRDRLAGPPKASQPAPQPTPATDANP